METFAKLFERFLVFVYHCFDRIVIQGYLPLLTRPEHIVHFFRDVHGQYPITPQILAKRTSEYRGWVEGYARNHNIPMLRAEKGMSKEDAVRPHLQRMERRNQHGVYCLFTSMEMGSTFTSKMPQFPTEDPNYRIIRRVPSRFLHYYFYIRDPVIGPLAMCVGTYLPFQTTYYLNGHNFMEIELRRQGVAFRKDDNAFLATADPKVLQAAADKLSAAIIEKRLNYWSWLLGPKFSEKDRKAVNLDRKYSINQIEYCRNFIFKRHFPIHKIFEQSCEMGLFRLAADKVAYIFGMRLTKRLRGKLYSVLEKLDHGHHVLRIYCKNLVGRMYEKFSTFLRVEVCVNRMKDLGLNKGLENLGRLRQNSRRYYGPLRRFRSAILERPRRLPFVSTDGSAHHGRQNQNRRHQDSRYPDDAADGGAAARRHTIERMAVHRHPPSHPHHLRPVGHHLHPLPTPIRSSQTESSRPARTHRKGLLLPPYRQRRQSGTHVYPVSKARLRTLGQLPVSSSARRNPQACQQGRNRLLQG